MQINELFSGIPNLQPCFTTSTLTDRLTETKLKRMSRFVTPLICCICHPICIAHPVYNVIQTLRFVIQSEAKDLEDI